MDTADSAPATIVPLTPQLLPDLLAFFEGPAFADNPKWASCYCQFPHEDHGVVDWESRTAGENRALACERVGAGLVRGYLAFDGDAVVGWCNAGPRTGFAALADDAVADDAAPDEASVGSVTCFVVAPTHRRRGIATAMLRAALDGFAARGLSVAEAYPRPSAASDAANHYGSLSMYLNAGFTVTREDADGSVVVRRALP